MQWCRGWVRTGHFVSFYQEGKITVRLKRRGEKKKSYKRREKSRQGSVERVSPTR
jgi:hypothetical protein